MEFALDKDIFKARRNMKELAYEMDLMRINYARALARKWFTRARDYFTAWAKLLVQHRKLTRRLNGLLRERQASLPSTEGELLHVQSGL